MTTWQPAPGETLISRRRVNFATGSATSVSEMRWFRDTERRDIQAELPGWPEGPGFTVRSKSERRLRKGGRFAAGFLMVAVVGVIEALSSGGSMGNISTLGSPQEPENEVEDFPVIWAAPGTLARTLPWQLDPGRRPGTYRTHMVVTDGRILVLGLRSDTDVPHDEVLWETLPPVTTPAISVDADVPPLSQPPAQSRGTSSTTVSLKRHEPRLPAASARSPISQAIREARRCDTSGYSSGGTLM